MLICTANLCTVDFMMKVEETDISIPTERPPSVDDHNHKKCSVVCASATNKSSPLPNVLQKLHPGESM